MIVGKRLCADTATSSPLLSVVLHLVCDVDQKSFFIEDTAGSALPHSVSSGGRVFVARNTSLLAANAYTAQRCCSRRFALSCKTLLLMSNASVARNYCSCERRISSLFVLNASVARKFCSSQVSLAQDSADSTTLLSGSTQKPMDWQNVGIVTWISVSRPSRP